MRATAQRSIDRARSLRTVNRLLFTLLYVAVALSAAGCVPIGVRVQNMLVL